MAWGLTTPSAAQEIPAPQTVIRINVNLVQVDAVVTDSKGNAVTDLTVDDFELLQDGEPQDITAFDFIDLKDSPAGNTPTRQSAPGPGSERSIPPPPVTLRPEQIRRTIALVVDDLALSFDGSVRVRQALLKWVENEMQAGDLVAVIRTSAGMGALQQFTSDKRLLFSAIDLVRYQVGRVGTSSFEPLRGDTPEAPAGPTRDDPTQFDRPLIDQNGTQDDRTRFDSELQRLYSLGSMGAVQYVIQGLRNLPGRKSLVLFSESMQLLYAYGRDQLAEEALKRLTDAANRSAVVIYAIDPRGVVFTGLTAADNTSGMMPRQFGAVLDARTNQVITSQEGMVTLAEKTGGLFLGNNDIQAELRQVVSDGDGYYLLGYRPDSSTFDQRTGTPKFHAIKVRVKRPDLRVRSRTGFFGTPDGPEPPALTPAAQIARALSSPFAAGDVRVHLTTLFSHSAKEGSVIKALLFFDPGDLTFTRESNGSQTAEVNIVAVTFDVNGRQIDGVGRTGTFHLPQKEYDAMIRQGLVYLLDVPVKKAGAYQMRVVVRDATSQRIGSATRFIEVPDVRKNRLAVSGIIIAADRTQGVANLQEGELTAEDPNATPAVRIFKSGDTLAYAYEIFNARRDRDNKHQLDIQTRLFRDGQEVYSTQSALEDKGLEDSQHVFGLGRMRLEKIPPGGYILQVIVTDRLAKGKDGIAAQTMDFEIRE